MDMKFEESRLAFAPALGTAFAVLLVVSAVFTVAPIGTSLELITVGIVVAVLSSWSMPATAMAVGLVAFLFANGFVLGQQGSLTWDGAADVALILVLAVVALSASFSNHLRLTARSRHFQGGRIHG